MKPYAIILMISLNAPALAAVEPEALGDVSGTVVSPFIEGAHFALTSATLTNCKPGKRDWRFYECDAKGTELKLTSTTGRITRIAFEKCFVIADDDPSITNRQYIFNGVYTEEGAGVHAATHAQLALGFHNNNPADVRGRFTLKEYEVSYALAGRRRVGKSLED
jgi:hypothetical protein